MLTQKREKFTRNLFEGMSQREAYRNSFNASRMIPATIDQRAYELAKNSEVQARLAELRQKAEDASVSTVLERKKILTQIQRATVADFVDEYGNLDIDSKAKLKTSAVAEVRTEKTLTGLRTTLKLRDPVSAISEHNKMEKIYSDAPVVNNDNRSINIIVRSSDAAGLTERISERTRSTDLQNQ
jgi:phage terminase small subunit